MRYLTLILMLTLFLNAKIYRDNNNSVVINDKNRLMWQDDKQVVTTLLNHKQAEKFCKNLDFAGYSDWRLPSVEEYIPIIYKKHPKNINYAFRYHIKSNYWAAKAHWRTLWFYADYIFFVSGTPYFDNRNTKKFVRCIRDIK